MPRTLAQDAADLLAAIAAAAAQGASPFTPDEKCESLVCRALARLEVHVDPAAAKTRRAASRRASRAAAAATNGSGH